MAFEISRTIIGPECRNPDYVRQLADKEAVRFQETEDECDKRIASCPAGSLVVHQGVVVCYGPKEDGSCGASIQGPCLEALDMRVTFRDERTDIA